MAAEVAKEKARRKALQPLESPDRLLKQIRQQVAVDQRAARAAKVAERHTSAPQQPAPADKKAKAAKAAEERAAAKVARQEQMEAETHAATLERGNKWRRERRASLMASEQLATAAAARAKVAEADAIATAKREAEKQQQRNGRKRGRSSLLLPSLAFLVLATAGWVRLPAAHFASESTLAAVRASPFNESLFNGEGDLGERFHGRADWAPTMEATLSQILDGAGLLGTADGRKKQAH